MPVQASVPADQPVPSACAAIVLAGGESLRFGTDKTRAAVGGTPLLELVLGAVAAARDRAGNPLDEVLVVGPWAPPGYRHLVEPDRFGGPLAALAFGLGQISAPGAIVLAADHPTIEPALLALLTSRSADGGDAVVPMRDGRPEPLVAWYRSSVAVTAERLVASGRRSMMGLLDEIDTRRVDEAQWRVVDPTGRSFADVDTPDDLPN